MKKNAKDTYISLSEMKREVFARRPDVKEEYDALGPEYDLISAILDARINKGRTQADIAKDAGTTQSAIARFEAGGSNPTLAFMQKLSKAVGARLEIRLVSPRR